MRAVTPSATVWAALGCALGVGLSFAALLRPTGARAQETGGENASICFQTAGGALKICRGGAEAEGVLIAPAPAPSSAACRLCGCKALRRRDPSRSCFRVRAQLQDSGEMSRALTVARRIRATAARCAPAGARNS